MPQKKNPDVPELIRAKTGRVYGDLVGLLSVLKGLPLSYNKDLQEDKEGMFDAAATLQASLRLLAGAVAKARFNRGVMRQAVDAGFMTATDFADYLAAKGRAGNFTHESRVRGDRQKLVGPADGDWAARIVLVQQPQARRQP